MPTTVMRSATGHDLITLEVDHQHAYRKRTFYMGLAGGTSLVTEEGQGRGRACGDARVEEVPGRVGGRGGGDDGRWWTDRGGYAGEEVRVDGAAMEVRHHDAGGQLGDLPAHADEDGLGHAGRR